MLKAIHVTKQLGLKTFARATIIPSVNKRCFSSRTKDHTVDTEEPLDFNELKFTSKVPLNPHVSPIKLIKTEPIKIDEETIQLLERFSLVNLDSKEAIQTLEDSIEFASKILHVDTTEIQPLYTVLELQSTDLRLDDINDGNCRDDILSNAKVTEEDYFVAPPGNIPVEFSDSIDKRSEF